MYCFHPTAYSGKEKMLIAISFDVLQTGCTALHFAAENGHFKTVEFLLIVGAMDHPNKVYAV